VWELNCRCVVPSLNVVLLASPRTLARRLSSRNRLSRFESTISRAAEIAAYEKAADFLRGKGYNVHVVANDQSIDKVVTRVTDLLRLT
jgi:thymidylate kinase